MTTATKISSGGIAPPSNSNATGRGRQGRWPDRALRYSSILWLLATAIGQWIFVAYVALQYIPALSQNGLPGLEHTALPDGYVPYDILGNLSIAFHVLVAIIIIGSGPLQLTPQVRNRFPTFHRYVGRSYISLAVITSIAGLYLVWTRGIPGGQLAYAAMTLDAVLIVLFGALTFYYAVKRQIDRHRRWALRLFMVVSAVWFFRIGLMFWFLATGGIGIDPETFQGPFISFIYFGQMAVPLAVLEAYFYAQRSKNAAVKSSVTLLVLAASLATMAGVFAASMGMWFPRL